MVKKIVLVIGILIAIALIGNYYLTTLIAGILLGTAVVAGITMATRYPNANVQNSFLAIVGWLAILYVVETLFPAFVFSFIVELIAYYFLIKFLYNPSPLEIVIFLILALILSKTLGILVVPHLTQLVRSITFF